VTSVLVDTNVLVDIITGDPDWAAWSSNALAEAMEHSTVVINPIVYGELSVGFQTLEALDAALPADLYRREPLPYAAAFLAGKAFQAYRRRGGTRTSPLADFYIGAHAAVAGYQLLTRDVARYRTSFPRLSVIGPGA
jgi:predicted nucleic acid-binding protein